MARNPSDDDADADATAARTHTYYYAGTSNFEQSLDVNYPPRPTSDGARHAPLVVLVVGSGWLGHRWFVYRPFSAQNAAGGRTIAAIGCVCVCVRHRGAYIPPPPAPLSALLLALLCWHAAVRASWWYVIVAALSLALWAGLARGAATSDEMMDDVAQALRWVRANERSLLQRRPRLAEAHRPQRALVGGYSSGGHVLSSLLRRPDVLAKWGLPAAAAGFDGVLLISGVHATRSGAPLDGSPIARFTTWLITDGIFGFGRPKKGCSALRADDAGRLPSPLHACDPALCGGVRMVPHLLVANEHEAFGVRAWERALSHLLCTPQYARTLRASDVPVRLEMVRSNHWTILASDALGAALRRALVDDAWPPTPADDDAAGAAKAAEGGALAARRRTASKSPARVPARRPRRV